MTLLPSFGGVGGSANAINNKGEVVGYSDIAGGNGLNAHAFLWNNGVMTDLGTFGATDSTANAINDNGWIVGETGYSNNAWLYMNGQSLNLSSLTLNAAGWQLQAATGINDEGQIVGYGQLKWPDPSVSPDARVRARAFHLDSLCGWDARNLHLYECPSACTVATVCLTKWSVLFSMWRAGSVSRSPDRCFGRRRRSN